MNRRTRTLLPTTGTLLEPRSLSTKHEREKLKDAQKSRGQYYNTNAHDLPELNEGDTENEAIQVGTEGMEERVGCKQA